MAMTAANYLQRYTDSWNAAGSYRTYKPDVGTAMGHFYGTWAFLYGEKSMMDKNGYVPSATANAYATQAEQELDAGWGYTTWKPTTAIAFAARASAAAFMFAATVKKEAPKP